MKYQYLLMSLLLFITACGPTTEEQATMTVSLLAATANSWTRTPTITNTATSTITPTPSETFTLPPSKTSPPAEIPTQTKTPTVSMTPSATSTQLPPLVAHEWAPESVLVLFLGFGGDGGHLGEPPKLVLFSDGQLFLTRKGNTGFPQMFTKTLSHKEICKIINTIDQFGYFVYDASTYQLDHFGRPIEYYSIDGASYQAIIVNAWDKVSESYYGLWSYIYSEVDYLNFPKDDLFQPPLILPALRNTFNFIKSYSPENMEIYNSERLELWVMQVDQADGGIVWPLTKPTLEELLLNSLKRNQEWNGWYKLVLEGEMASNVFQAMEESIDYKVYTDGNISLMLYGVPIYPYSLDSYLPDVYYPLVRENGTQLTPTPFSMQCDPSDGYYANP